MSHISYTARPRLRAAAALPLTAALAGALILAGPTSVFAATSPVAAVVPGTHPAWATDAADRGSVPDAETVTSTVYLSGRDQAAMAAYAAAVSDAASPDYGHFLTPDQFQARFGASTDQSAQVQSWLRSSGLKIDSQDGHEVTVTGTAADAERAFGTRLHRYSVHGRMFRAPVSDAKLPDGLAGDVLTVTGLDDMPTLVRHSGLVGQESTPTIPGVTGTTAGLTTGSDGAPFLGPTPCSAYYGQLKDTTDPAFMGQAGNPYTICGYVPSQMRGAYGVDRTGYSGRGVTVAIVDAYGSPTMLSDANTYAANHHEPAFAAGQYTESVTPAQWTSQAACGGTAGWAGEESLDVEAVHAMALGANVHYYGANSCNDPDFLTVFTQIVDNHTADLVSDSWGEPVYASTGNEPAPVMAEYTSLFQQGAIEGIGFNFSSGDCGAEDPATGCGAADASTTPQADFPSSDPWATSVGGNSVAIDKYRNVDWTTSWGTDAFALASGVWTSAGWQFGGGGGTSAVYPQPAYQQRVVRRLLATSLPDSTRTTDPMRVTPDVSMDADPFTGFLFGMTQALPDGTTGYAESDIGGTSLACPLFVGLQADLIQARGGVVTGFANPALYTKYGSYLLRDVTGHGPGLHAASILPPFNGEPTLLVTFGDDRLLKATHGYDDATGVGTASKAYLWRW